MTGHAPDMLNGAPHPETPCDDFRRYEQAYFDGCRRRFAQLDTLAVKWEFEDLIPGLSDCDFRLILDSSVGASKLIALDEAIGAVHTRLCHDHPHWARMLEHPPGVVLTWSELQDPRLYNPESRLWRACRGDVERFGQYLDTFPPDQWQPEDERFALGRFADYYGRYQQDLDPPTNLGEREAEYAWHSRAMHYFAPAIQAGVCVIDRRVVRGKLPALRRASQILDGQEIFAEIQEWVERHYQTPDLTNRRALHRFEDRMVNALREIRPLVFEAATIVDLNVDDRIETLRQRLSQIPEDPLKVLFNAIRYARCRKGRLAFYLEAPAHFDARRLIDGDLAKMSRHVLAGGLSAYAQIKRGKSGGDSRVTVDEIIDSICPSLITRREADLLRTVWNQLRSRLQPGGGIEAARRIVTIWNDVHLILESMFNDARDSTGNASCPTTSI